MVADKNCVLHISPSTWGRIQPFRIPYYNMHKAMNVVSVALSDILTEIL